jgi:transcription elongation factor GreA
MCRLRRPTAAIRVVDQEMMHKVPMTKEGYKTLLEEVKRLKTVERPAIVKAIEDARSHGDLSENAEYHAARERQGFIEGRLAELEDKLARAEVIDISRLSGSVVRFGATVTVADEDTDEESTYRIVGEEEANISAGRLSVTSPLARALIGKQKGDTFELTTPGGSKGYEVVKVTYD